jgi:ABC-type multidrug transport system fused ATPase/permease subunit
MTLPTKTVYDKLSAQRKILDLLTSKEKRRGGLVFCVVTCMAVFEVAGVASVMPFLSVMGNPELVESNEFLAMLFAGLDFESRQRFLIFLGVSAFVIVLFSSIFRVFAHYVMNRFVEMRRHSVAERLLETYLRQPYVFFLGRHSGDLAKSILSEVDLLVQNVFRPGLQAAAYAVVAVAILLLLIAVDPWLAIGVASCIGGLYALIYLVVRGLLSRIGRERADANLQRFTTASEALGGIKAIKLLGREHAYLSRFRPASIRLSRHMANNATLGLAPKFLIEAVAIGGVLVLAVLLMVTTGGVGEILPILGLYAFAGYKLLPAFQNIYSGVAKLRFGGAAVDDIHRDLHQRVTLTQIDQHMPAALSLNEEIRLEAVAFTYPAAREPALEGINVTVPAATTVGLVGGTGAGKTTLVDIVLGLLYPTEGRLTVDGVPVTDENVRAWQQALGYVPQEIFLSDASVAENIAFGVPASEVDYIAIERAARMAQVHNFIVNQLPNGYGTEVGERGVRLSGGQRQRIGIARALYNDPDVLVFDEATSALDNATERAVMKAVNDLHEQKTIILIAHRLSTVESCDRIYLLEDGQLVDSGTYSELLTHSRAFQAMVGSE